MQSRGWGRWCQEREGEGFGTENEGCFPKGLELRFPPTERREWLSAPFTARIAAERGGLMFKPLLGGAIIALLFVSFTARADVVTDWNEIALDAIRVDRTPPPIASRNLAILHVAIYDSVNGVLGKNKQKFESYLVTDTEGLNGSAPAAAAASAHRILTALYPAQQATFDEAYHK